jgi:hypothetical protein
MDATDASTAEFHALVLSGVMAWPQLRDNNLLTGGAIIFYLMVGWVLVSAALTLTYWRGPNR